MTDSSALEWHRMHPATPLVKAWILLLALLLYGSRQAIDAVTQGEKPLDLAELVTNLTAWLVVGATTLLVIGGMYLAWRRRQYALDALSLHVRQGVLFRSQVTVRFDRIEAVDVRRPFGARILGLAELSIETAGGDDSAVGLGYLKTEEANLLRAQLLDRQAAVQRARVADVASTDHDADQPLPPGTSVAPAAEPEAPVISIPTARVIVAELTSITSLVGYLTIVSLGTYAVATQTWSVLVALIAVAWGFGSAGFGAVTRNAGYRATLWTDRLKISRGLFDHTTQTVPAGRIHAIVVSQDPIKRLFGWWTIKATIAGYGSEKSEQELLPVGTAQDVLAFLGAMTQHLGGSAAQSELWAAMVGRREHSGDTFVSLPRRMRWWNPLGFARVGYRAHGDVLYLRLGRVFRAAAVIMTSHCQSVTVNAGPLDRRRRVASVRLDAVPGPTPTHIDHLDLADAIALRDYLAAAAARRPSSATSIDRGPHGTSDI